MITTVFGKKGSGKTTLIKGSFRIYKKPVVILDILGNFNDSLHVQCEDIPTAIYSVNDFCAGRKLPFSDGTEKPHPGIIVVKASNIARGADYLSAALWEANGGTLVCDEVDAIRMPDAKCFDELIRYGRNHGVDIVTACRRPAELSKNITAGSDIWICFRTHEIRDVNYLSEVIGEENAQSLRTLPPYHGIFLDHMENNQGKFSIDRNGVMTQYQVKELNPVEVPKELEKQSEIVKEKEEIQNATS